MTIPALKKRLAALERKELEQMLCNLYKYCDYAEQSINLQLLDESYSDKLLEQYQEKLYKIFFPINIVNTGFSLQAAKNVLSDFKKVCQNTELITELKLYFVEYGIEFTNTYGDINERFYDAVCDAFHDVADAVSGNEELFEELEDRLTDIVDDSDGIGWGVHDYLVDEYYGIKWVTDE